MSDLLPCPFCGAEMQSEGGGYEHPHSDTCPLDSLYIQTSTITAWNTRTPAPDVSGLVEALRYYSNTFCEGFCKDLPQAGTYHESMDDQCSGCKARAELAKWEKPNAL